MKHVDTSGVTNEQAPGFVRDQLNGIPIEKIKSIVLVVVARDDKGGENCHIGAAGTGADIAKSMAHLNAHMITTLLETNAAQTVPEGTTKH